MNAALRAHLSRRSFIALASAVSLQPALAAAQSPAALTSVRVASAADEDILPTLWAVENGIFRKRGLDVHLQPSNSGAAVAAAVVGGSIDIGKSSLLSLISAHMRGVPIVLIASAAVYNSAIPTVGLLVRKDSPIRTGRDLNGKTISVQSLNDQFAISIRGWVDQNGGDSSTLQFLELPNSAAPEAIADGRVDAGSITTPRLSEALATGKLKSIGRPFDAIGHLFVQAAYFCTNDYANSNRDIVERFVQSIAESATYCDTHHAQTAVALSQFTKVPIATIEHMPRTQLASSLDPRKIQPVIDAAYKYKTIAKTFDAKDMIAPFVHA